MNDETEELVRAFTELEIKDSPPFKGIMVVFRQGECLQVELGHYPDGCKQRVNTHGRRVYVDAGGPALVELLAQLAADIEAGTVPKLPVWGRGAKIPGYRKANA